MLNFYNFLLRFILSSCVFSGLLFTNAYAENNLTVNSVTQPYHAVLYPAEKIVELAGYPALMYFSLGKVDKPLIIFVPGGYNLARIAYGTPNTKASDYLAYWFNQKGFTFLGLSYPLDNKVFSDVYPGFTIKDWAAQIIDAVKLQIDTHQLPKTFVMLGWSMAGKAVNQVNALAKENGLDMIYISLSSDPSIRGLASTELFEQLIKTPTAKGLSSDHSLISWFLNQIHEQNKLNQHVIINDSTYIQDIMGDQPVDLLATSTRFENNTFIKDTNITLTDTLAMDYDAYPMLGLIHGDYRSDYINALFTRFDWSPMLARAVYNSLTKKMHLDELFEQEWNGLKKIIEHAPQIMSREVHGNHLFFLGQTGAEQTVTAVQSLLAMRDQILNIHSSADLCTFTGKFKQQLQGDEPNSAFCINHNDSTVNPLFLTH